MDNIFEQFVLTETSIRLCLLLVVLILARYVSLSEAYHPGTLLRYLATKLTVKVNKRDARQQALSGALSTLLLIASILSLASAVLYFANVPWFFEALFLFIAIERNSTIIVAKQLTKSVEDNKKALARELLSKICLRDTQSLSMMGICKAAIEGLVQRPMIHCFNIAFYYAIFGIHIALTVALINALASNWNPKKRQFRHFGRVPSQLAQRLNAPIQYIIALLCGLLFGMRYIKIRTKWHNKAIGAILATTAQTLNRQLGGAVMYDGIKIRRPTLGTDHVPQAEDIKHVQSFMDKLEQALLTLFAFSLFASLLFSNL